MMRMIAMFAVAMLLLASTMPKPARADILACINALTGVKTAFDLAKDFADPEFLLCTQQMAAGDAAMIATVALIVGADTAGAFDSEASCGNMVMGPLGQLVAGVLTSAGPASAALKAAIGDEDFKKLVEFAAAEGASQITSSGPLQPIFGYMNCGCKVYGKGQALVAAANGWLDDVKECAGVIEDVGKALISLVESGADAVGNLFGHEQDGPVATLTTRPLACGTWQFLPDNAKFSHSSTSSSAVSETKTGYHTEIISCECAKPSVMETKDLGSGQIAVRCACSNPPNSVYNSKSKSCGCSADMKLQGGSCVACNVETRSETTQGINVKSGYVSKGVCMPVERTCAPGTTPVKSPSEYYYECQPICDAKTFFVKAQSGVGGSCQACPANFVPDANALSKGQLQCQQCPRGYAAGTGALQCIELKCENGIDPGNPNACKPACQLEGEGRNKRLVCKGRALDNQVACPAGFVSRGGVCVPEVYHKPDDVIVQDGIDHLRLPTREMDLNPQKRRSITKTPPRIERRQQRRLTETGPAIRRDRGGPVRDSARDELIGPADRGGGDADIGAIIDLGIGIGRGLGSMPDVSRERRGGGSQFGRGAFETMPRDSGSPSRRGPPAVDIQRHQKD